ncbi:MAG: GGDEF domain-containing protein [Pseudomonadota bacterium]
MSMAFTPAVRAEPVDESDIRRLRGFRLLRFYLITLTLTAVGFGTHNFIVDGLSARPFTWVLWSGAALGPFSIWRFYRCDDWLLPSYVLSVASAGVTLALIIVSKGLGDAYAVVLVHPLISFPLLGLRRAGVLFLIYASAVLATLVYGQAYWPFFAPLSTVLNVLAAVVLGGLSIAFMEYSKQAAIRRAVRLSLTDELTGLSNRKAFEQALERLASHPGSSGTGVALILCDVDRFKAINDEFGHDVGDRILHELARLLSAQEVPVECLARWGGEEFALIVPGVDLERARSLAESLRREIAAHDFATVGQVTASFGVDVWRGRREVHDFFKAVDAAMYRAKAGGRNRVEAPSAPAA